MAKPAIVAIDDDPQVLAAVRADLRNQYAADYRIVAADSGQVAVGLDRGSLEGGSSHAASYRHLGRNSKRLPTKKKFIISSG